MFKHPPPPPSLSVSPSLSPPHTLALSPLTHWLSHALVGTVTLSKAMRWEQISEPLNMKNGQNRKKYIQSKNTLKTALGRSKAEKNGFLCFDHFLSHF